MHFDETLKYIELIKDKIDISTFRRTARRICLHLYWYQNYMMKREFNVHFDREDQEGVSRVLVNTVRRL
jgi:hypothetical protein